MEDKKITDEAALGHSEHGYMEGYAKHQQREKERLVGNIIGFIEPGYDFENPREGLRDTPKRVLAMYEEIFGGYKQDPAEILKTSFTDEVYDEIVLVRDIPFYSHCEHHMVPFFGVAHVAYIPDTKNNKGVVGISKLARLVDCFAKRLQIQERMTAQIADALQEHLQPLGIAVIIEAEHLCMAMRGIKKPGTSTVTSAMRGVCIEKDNLVRQELMDLIRRK